MGGASLLTPRPSAARAEGDEDRIFVRRLTQVDPPKVAARVALESGYDPDLWVISLETRNDRNRRDRDRGLAGFSADPSAPASRSSVRRPRSASAPLRRQQSDGFRRTAGTRACRDRAGSPLHATRSSGRPSHRRLPIRTSWRRPPAISSDPRHATWHGSGP